jgi:hypothetical protein
MGWTMWDQRWSAQYRMVAFWHFWRSKAEGRSAWSADGKQLFFNPGLRGGNIPPPEKLRQTWAALAPSQHKTHYVTSPQSGKPRKWPPDTCGIAFEKLILLLNNRFDTLYGAVGYVEVGIPGVSGFSCSS